MKLFTSVLAALTLNFGYSVPIAHAEVRQSVQAIPGEIYLNELTKLIQNAQHSITILHFNFSLRTNETKKLAELLRSRKAQSPNLKIDIILEGEKDLDSTTGVAYQNKLTRDFFAGSGINVYLITGLRASGVKPGVTHAKAIIIDDLVLTGSTNLTGTSLTKNNEFNLSIKDGKAANFLRQFVEDLLEDSETLNPKQFAFAKGKILTDNLFHKEALDVINESANGEQLYVATYLFQTSSPELDADAREILDALLRAKTRGVTVKVYLEQNTDPKFLNPGITKSNRVTAQALVEANVEVYFDPGDKISHAKIIALDGKKKVLLQGSTNLYRGDFNENHQINVRIDDASVVTQAITWLGAKMVHEGVLSTK